MRAFRNEQVAAPLKEPCSIHSLPLIRAFRNEQVAAPLKASLGLPHACVTTWLSATNKLRPH